MINRRSFLSTAAGFSAAPPPPTSSLAAPAAAGSRKKRIKLGISTYSYWHFKTAKVPIETVIDKTARLGVEGVDILHRQMEIAERAPLDAAGRAYLRKLKRHAFLHGVALICLSTQQ